MPKLLKIRVPLIVTADGKWAAMGSHRDEDNPDWGGIVEHVDYDNPPVMPQRYWVETAVEIPETKTARGAAMPADGESH